MINQVPHEKGLVLRRTPPPECGTLVFLEHEAEELFKPNKKCFRSLAKLALTEDEIKSIRTPVLILFGDRDFLKNGYVGPLQRVRKDWRVIEIKDADHITCIRRPQFQEEIGAWLKKNSK